MITQEYLKSILNYDPETGIFTNKVFRAPHGVKGASTGSKDTYGHLQIKIKGKLYRAHRLAWLYVYGSHPEGEIDHKNRIKDDNRIINLRECDARDNRRNTEVRKRNRLGVKGVDLRGRRYRAQIDTGKKKIHLGLFNTLEEAKLAYNEAAKKYHGEFACY